MCCAARPAGTHLRGEHARNVLLAIRQLTLNLAIVQMLTLARHLHHQAAVGGEMHREIAKYNRHLVHR